MKKRSNRKGALAEEFLLNALREAIPNLEETTNSGATHGNKDLGTYHWLVEVKSTKHQSYRVEQSLIEDIDLRAFELDKVPILGVLTNAEQPNRQNAFLVLPLEFGIKLLKEYNDNCVKNRDSQDKES